MIASIDSSVRTGDVMAKRKAAMRGGDSPPAAPRKQLMAVELLTAQLAACTRSMQSIKQLLGQASEAEIPAIWVDGATQMERAGELLDQFSDNLVKGFNQAKREQRSRG